MQARLYSRLVSSLVSPLPCYQHHHLPVSPLSCRPRLSPPIAAPSLVCHHRPCLPRPFFFPKMQFFWRSQCNDNKSLIETLQQDGVIKSETVAEVMKQIDRGLFTPAGGLAYVDSPMPIGYNATISAPHMHAFCLELLEERLQPGMHALDVGSGTGYLTACFALMVGEQGQAVGVEHIPELVEQSIQNVRASKVARLLDSGSLSFHVSDGRLGWPDAAPYDAIHVGAAALEIPEPLLEQLKPGGRLVIPVGDIFQDLQVVDKQADGSVKKWTATSVRYVPLTSRSEQVGS